MSISMHSASVPVFMRLLGNAIQWLDKAQAHADEKKFDASNYLGLRLAPDMLPLVRQVQIASDAAKGCVARLAGVEVPKWEDNEASLADLRLRMQKTVDYVAGFSAAQVDGSEERMVEIPRRNAEPLRMAGEAYLKHFALPNFYFHCTTLYALLRAGGVQLGKADYLGR
jgi:hypothetical protein